jgi:hypothetical protein
VDIAAANQRSSKDIIKDVGNFIAHVGAIPI